MNKIAVFAVTLLVALLMTQAAVAKETYFRFSVDSREELSKITRIISIDNVKDGIVHAYANEKELAAFEELGYDYEILPHPSSLVEIQMASDAKDLEDWDTYPTYEQYVAMMYQFEIDYPAICQIDSIGHTVDGRGLLFAKISDNVGVEEDEPEVMHTSTMHGNETTGYVLCLRLIDSILTSYGTDTYITNLVDETEIWICPAANPDGTYASGNHTVSGATRYNANGYDLNRNFPCPVNGPEPNGTRQIETQFMMNFADAHSIVIA
ncbi:MAG: zinc carboxypeptidase, partial [Candidatus Zixiibacteriota bacterium]